MAARRSATGWAPAAGAANDPDKGQPSAEVDSNPYSVDASNPLSILVTGAGGNDLLRVRPWGKVQTRAVFPFADYQPVPTGVVRAPGGGAYVGQLTGFPFPAGAANVFRVRGRGRHARRAADAGPAAARDPRRLAHRAGRRAAA